MTDVIDGKTPFKVPAASPELASRTDQMLCVSQLRLQLTPNGQASTPQGLWSLANDYHYLDEGFTLSLKMSDLVDKTLLKFHNAPLPIFQVG